MVFDVISEIKNEASSNGKLEILKNYKDDSLLRMVLEYTYSPMYNYFTKHQVDIISEVMDPIYMDFEFVVFPILDKLANRQVTGHDAINLLNEAALSLEPKDRMVLNMIIDRDLDCGLAAKSINKVIPNLIPVVPYMRCSLTDKIDKITYPAVVQQKCDGMFVNVIYKDGNAKFLTRNGTEFTLNCLKEDLLHGFHVRGVKNIVLHGELLVMTKEGDVEDRKIGNGLINSLIKKEQTIQSLEEKIKEKKGKTQDKLVSELARKLAEYDETDKRLQLVLWDAVSYDDWIKGESKVIYDDRLRKVIELVDCAQSSHIKDVESCMATCYEEAQEYYREQIRNGYEGAVLKNLGMLWKDHTSPEQIKLKAEKECELKVIGYEPGTGKYEGGIGSLICESIDSRLLVSVGSGLTDGERGFIRADETDSSKGLVLMDEFDCNCYVGKIISVKFNEFIVSDSKDTGSLFLPRFVEVRTDKNEADSLEKIKSM